MTIKVLGFHKREQLIEDWRTTYKETLFKIGRLACTLAENEDEFEKGKEKLIKEIINGKIPYSFVALQALKYYTGQFNINI